MRCEGWRRKGGAFTLGPIKWEQCPDSTVAILTVEQDGATSEFPACGTYWNEAIERGIQIVETRPIPEEDKNVQD